MQLDKERNVRAKYVTLERKRVSSGRLTNYLGISKNALRNYEEKQIAIPDISENGYRYYDEQEVSALSEVRMYRELGVPLPKIQTLQRTKNLHAQHEILNNYLQQLQTALVSLQAQMNGIRRKMSSISAASEGEPIHYIEDGPILYWRSRLTGRDGQESPNDTAWLVAMPYSCISGRLQFEKMYMVHADCGVAIAQQDFDSHPLPIDDYVRILDCRKSITMIAACRMKDGQYLSEDYLPLLQYAESHGIRTSGTIVTYGLCSIDLRENVAYYLRLYLPVEV
ncbi:MAG: MerR family transcriptional regulator [Eubacteriales bacterium]|nr:MerR family transcriptional regulator [Eubacteriales bacterium]